MSRESTDRFNYFAHDRQLLGTAIDEVDEFSRSKATRVRVVHDADEFEQALEDAYWHHDFEGLTSVSYVGYKTALRLARWYGEHRGYSGGAVEVGPRPETARAGGGEAAESARSQRLSAIAAHVRGVLGRD